MRNTFVRVPFEQTTLRPQELFMRFEWVPGRCLFDRRVGLVTQIVDVLWDGQRVRFEACQSCVFRIFAAFERRWWTAEGPPAYRNPDAYWAPQNQFPPPGDPPPRGE